jgi:hypothetical protein
MRHLTAMPVFASSNLYHAIGRPEATHDLGGWGGVTPLARSVYQSARFSIFVCQVKHGVPKICDATCSYTPLYIPNNELNSEECRLLGYKNPVRTSQETHYVSATESSQLMLCNIWGFHGVEYEECRLLGYKNPVRTSQETHYVSATESSQLMLCNIW